MKNEKQHSQGREALSTEKSAMADPSSLPSHDHSHTTEEERKKAEETRKQSIKALEIKALEEAKKLQAEGELLQPFQKRLLEDEKNRLTKAEIKEATKELCKEAFTFEKTIEPLILEHKLTSVKETIDKIKGLGSREIELLEFRLKEFIESQKTEIAIKISGFSLLFQKPDIKNDKLKSFLVEDRKKFESIGCGSHNEVYYFGTILYKDGLPYQAVVTSDKKVYLKQKDNDEIRHLFGLNYKGNFYEESLDNIFSKEAVYKWVYGNTKDISLKSVYDQLIKQFKKYVYLENEKKYSLLACYRIASFFMPVWRARARLFLFAEAGSAKSRLTQILHNTGFNSIALGDWTLAYLKEIIQSTRGETHIDDFETLDEEKKQATTRLVKVGFMKGFKAGKMGEGKNRKPEVNDLFNTTTLNNTEGLDFISTDRCITIRIPKISKNEYDEEPRFEEAIWKELRDELYILGLKYPEEVRKAYDGLKSESIKGRLFFIIKPELAIARLISEEVYNEVESFWKEEIEQRTNIDYETDWEFLAFKQIYELLSTLSTLPTNSTLSTHSTLSTTGYFRIKEDVVEPVGKRLYGEDEFKLKKRSMGIKIGNLLSRSPIFHKREVVGHTQYKVDLSELKSLLEAKGFLKQIIGECVDSVAGKTGITPQEPKEIISTEKLK